MIELISCNGKEYPFLFSWPAFKEWSKSTELLNELDMFEEGIYLGFKYGAKKQNAEVFSKDEMGELFGDDAEFQDKAFQVFTKHLGVQKKILENLKLTGQ
jgi:hypothetical protein